MRCPEQSHNNAPHINPHTSASAAGHDNPVALRAPQANAVVVVAVGKLKVPQMVLIAVRAADTLEKQGRDGLIRVTLPLAKRVVELPDDGIARAAAFGLNQHHLLGPFITAVNFGLHALNGNLNFPYDEIKLRGKFPALDH